MSKMCHTRDIISSEQLRKLEQIKPFGHSKASKKILTHFAHFPRPGENDPYVETMLVPPCIA